MVIINDPGLLSCFDTLLTLNCSPGKMVVQWSFGLAVQLEPSQALEPDRSPLFEKLRGEVFNIQKANGFCSWRTTLKENTQPTQIHTEIWQINLLYKKQHQDHRTSQLNWAEVQNKKNATDNTAVKNRGKTEQRLRWAVFCKAVTNLVERNPYHC